jgi:signal transduction histidine kinase
MPFAVNSNQWFNKTIVVLPAFYQTIVFKLAIIFCALVVVYFLWRSKVQKMEKELQLRTTIAGDLHDDIGSTLNSISVYTEVAGQQLPEDAVNTRRLLDNMGIASRSMIDKMNDIVWAVNPKNDDFENVLERMRFFAAELLSGKNMLLKFEVDEKIKKLKFTMQQRKNIYLVYKEAVNNAYKYSGGTTVYVKITGESNMLHIVITDNGNGFEAAGKNGAGGNGLTNMKNRAKEIGGKLTVSSTAGGVTIHLQLRRP